MQAKIAAKEPLANGYTGIFLESECFENIKPGHYFILADFFPSYAFKKSKNRAYFIIPPNILLPLDNNNITISSPMGDTFTTLHLNQFSILISDEYNLNACLFYLKEYRQSFNGIVFIGAESAFPFYACPSRKIISNIPSDVIASIPLLEDWGIANRLANLNDIPGCFLGTAKELANLWMNNAKKNDVFVFQFPRLICP